VRGEGRVIAGQGSARTPELTHSIGWLWHCEQDPAATLGYKNDFHKWNL